MPWALDFMAFQGSPNYELPGTWMRRFRPYGADVSRLRGALWFLIVLIVLIVLMVLNDFDWRKTVKNSCSAQDCSSL